jgi:hypothetical protein
MRNYYISTVRVTNKVEQLTPEMSRKTWRGYSEQLEFCKKVFKEHLSEFCTREI